jgi:hypothetical protein
MPDIHDFIRSLQIGAVQQFGGLAVAPLLGHPARATDYIVLDDALKSGRFWIAESTDSGIVALLRATNLTDHSVFLMEGEELIGAKQNRVLNLSLLVPPGATIDIPVSCVEAGRWQRRSERFSVSPNTQFAAGRARKVAQVTDSLVENMSARSDQSDVWATIDAKAARLGIRSGTSAMSAMFERHVVPIEKYNDMLQATPGQVGSVFLVGGEFAGLDAFDSDTTYAKLHAKLVAGYAADALEVSRVSTAITSRLVDEFLDRVTEAPTEAFNVTGAGRSVRLASRTVAGAALELDGRLLHLSAFARHGASSSRDHRA